MTDLDIVPREIRAHSADVSAGQAAIATHAEECREAGLVGVETAALVGDVFGLVLAGHDDVAHASLRTLRERAQHDPDLATTLRDLLSRVGTEPFGSQVALLRLIEAQDTRIASLEGEVRDLTQDVQSGRGKRRSIELAARKLARLRFFEGIFFGAMACLLVAAAFVAFSGAGAGSVPIRRLF